MTITSRSSGIPRDLPNPLKPGLNSNETDLGIRSGPPSMNCDYSDPESSDRMGFESQGEPRSYSSRTLEVNSFPEGELQLYSPISPDYDLEVTPNTNWDWRTLSLTRIYWGHVENEEPQFSTLPRSTFKHGVIFPLPPDHLPSPGTPSRRTRGAKSSILVSENLATTVSPYFRFPASPIIVPPQFTEQCSSTGSPLRCLVSSYREIDPEKVNHSTRSYFYSFSPGIGEVLPTISSDHDGTVHNANNTEVEDERHDPMTCGCRRVLGKENIEDKNFEEALRLMSDDEDMSDIQKGCEELFLAGRTR
ncbi:hypothetical protein L218DRAFT_467401 [Marasmius fiardii PR-910]|nr:hypothetical protein L218DRAFT_467401 [Marasmius fiardii PR-910]